MKGYKAYEKGLVCRGKQYKIGEIFEEEKAEICGIGMHYCENPLDCLDYYPLIDSEGNFVEMTEVEDLDSEDRKTENDRKFCTKKLKIGTKVSLGEIIKAGFEFLFEKSKEETEKIDNRYNSRLASSGDRSQLASSGYYSRLASSGNNSAVANIGINGMAKAAKYSWITLAEHCWEDGLLKLKCVKTEQVDGDRIKPDTWYKLQDGEFKEV